MFFLMHMFFTWSNTNKAVIYYEYFIKMKK